MSKPFDEKTLPPAVSELFKLGPLAWVLVVQEAIHGGNRNASFLADIAYHLHHPERKGKPIQPHERADVEEWLAFRELIRPLVRYSGMGKIPDGEGPLDGYVCSSFGGAASQRLKTAESKGCMRSNGQNRRTRLTESDILFISGHHYAGAAFNEPLHFDAIDMREMKFISHRVRLIMVSSCNGLRVNALHNFRKRFPSAYIFGWVSPSPLVQSGLMKKFIASLDSTVYIASESGMKSLITKWREYIEKAAEDKSSVAPRGLGYAAPNGKVSYYAPRKGKWQWITRS
jgi:hypothetical protein